MFKHMLLVTMLSTAQHPAFADADCESVTLDARSAIEFNDANAAILLLEDPSQKTCLLDEYISKLERVVLVAQGKHQPLYHYDERVADKLKALCTATTLMTKDRSVEVNDWRQMDESTFIYDINTCVIVHDDNKTTAVVTP